MTPSNPNTRGGSSWLIYLLTFLCVGLISVMIGYWITRDEAETSPANDSAEAGFSRDMIVHHNQAVEMAIILQNRGEHETLQAIALDILLTQQNQIGQMQGWLTLWGLPYSGTQQPMAWMEMSIDGLMPGMATDEQMTALRNASGADADRLFIELMIPHHQAGIHMAEAVLERSDLEAIESLAQSIIAGQQREIAELELLAEELGAATPSEGESESPEAEGTAEPEHDH